MLLGFGTAYVQAGGGLQEGEDGEDLDEERLAYGDGTCVAEASAAVVRYAAFSAEGSAQHPASDC